MDDNPYRSPRAETASARRSWSAIVASLFQIGLGTFCALFGIAWFVALLWLLVGSTFSVLVAMQFAVNLGICGAALAVGKSLLLRGVEGIRTARRLPIHLEPPPDCDASPPPLS